VEKRKAYEKPKPGIFYMVPEPKKEGSYEVHSELQEDSKDVLHIFLFDKIKRILEKKFKRNMIHAYDSYMGLPRGRVIEPPDSQGEWIVAYGGDFPLNKYREDIISDFSLRDAQELGKVKFEVDPHEKMAPKDRKEVEKALGIRFMANGWVNEKTKPLKEKV
jgi:hypothetical protein